MSLAVSGRMVIDVLNGASLADGPQIVTPPPDTGAMTKQLTLINGSHRGGPHAWRLDEQTREIGRRGLVDARAALVQGRRRGHAVGGPGPATRGGAPPGARDRPAA
jgi:hypothetical protein